ncbi:uncharacterized protein LOC130810767 [Amaranthus tricolor]|uniref:uncharacterized protein LOC130810767 n=1 Tax=Amaranthus tricolor TaxID=29722 RepID=UPI0025891E76|nr:uncharacterized protein LOC130810767 [Amaranthus tricolor]
MEQATCEVAYKHVDVERLIVLTNLALNTIGVSYKRRDEFRQKQAEMVEKALFEGELLTGKGLNQEVGLQRPGDTRWVNMLDALVVAGDDDIAKTQAILDGISNGLSLSLQRRDQDVVNAMSLLGTTKRRFQKTRDEGWESLMNEVKSFCVQHDIDILIEWMQLDCRFPEISTDLLIGVGCLNPANSFSYYNKEKVFKMAKLYTDDFDYFALDCLSFELDTFIDNFSTNERFSSISTLGEFSKTLVQSATVERMFSAMEIIKAELRNKISDEFLNDTVALLVMVVLLGWGNGGDWEGSSHLNSAKWLFHVVFINKKIVARKNSSRLLFVKSLNLKAVVRNYP